MSTKRIQLVVGYDGTDFCGWAAQTGQRTVQRTLRDAVRQISGEDYEIIGASRTDGGAHARGQVCHFDTDLPIEPMKWAQILNRVLPIDLAILRSRRVAMTCHSRFSAKDRWYRYRIIRTPDPHRTRFVHVDWHELNVAMMQHTAQKFAGEHDFRAFSEELEPRKNAVRRIDSIRVHQNRDEVQLDIVGTAFIRGMMRRIAGSLFEVGRGYREASDIELLLDPKTRDQLQWPVVLPAKGLTLMRVRYGGRPWHGATTTLNKNKISEEIDLGEETEDE